VNEISPVIKMAEKEGRRVVDGTRVREEFGVGIHILLHDAIVD